MKNRITVCAVMALLFTPHISNARAGLEFTGESWKMDGKEFITDMRAERADAIGNGDDMTGKVTQGKMGGAAKFFLEGNSRFRLGISAGYGVMPTVSYKLMETDNAGYTWNGDDTNKITYIPVDLYFKHTSESGGFSLFGGGGADYVMASTDLNYKSEDTSSGYSFLGKGTLTQKKVMPHVQAGCEVFLAKWISINLSAKYLFSAILDNLTGHFTVNGVDQGKHRLVMTDSPPYGQEISLDPTSAPLPTGDRPFKFDLSGLRANVGLKIYFK